MAQQRQVWSYNGDPTKAALLHIEYGQAPAGAGTDPPVISLSSTELGRSAFEGSTAASQHFSLMNSGATALNYTTTVTYNKGSGWLSLTPSTTSGTLGAGEEQNFSVSFNTTGLIAGTYDAIVKFTDANAANSPQEVKVSLAIMPQGSIQCGDIPLYTQNIASPAVMILLDLSGSMLWEIDLVKETDVLPVTPNLSPVVQEIVNRNGWASGNAITFIIDKVSGSGFRYARSFDGYNPSAALFHVEYNDGSGVKTIETRIKKATDDGECANAIPFSTSTQKLTIGRLRSGVALRRAHHPQEFDDHQRLDAVCSLSDAERPDHGQGVGPRQRQLADIQYGRHAAADGVPTAADDGECNLECGVLDRGDHRDEDRRGENRHRRTGEGHRHLLGLRLLGERFHSRLCQHDRLHQDPRRLQRAHRRATGETAGGGGRSDNLLQHAVCPVDGCRPKIFFQTKGGVGPDTERRSRN